MTALPPLASGALPPQSATPAATLTVPEVPAELNALPAGTRIRGVVVATVDGAMTLKTDSGTIMVQNAGVSGLALPKDARVSLLVQTAAPGMVLRIIQVESPQVGQNPSAPPQAQPAAFRGASPGGQVTTTPAVAMTAAAGPRIEAIVLRAGAASSPPGGRAPVADAGPMAPPMFPADTRLALRMLGSAPKYHSTGNGSLSRASPLGAGHIITASLVRTDGANRPLLTSSAGLLVLAAPMPLPHGWSGEFEILDVSPPLDAASNKLAARGRTDGSCMESWRTLGDILGCLSESDPAAARRMSQAVLPQPTSSLAANLLKVLGLLRGGDIRKWIGKEAYLALARTRPDLLETLASDIQKLSPGADGDAGNDWRTYIIPVIADGALATIRMRVRSGARQNEKGGAAHSDSTRFVLDLALSRLGRMQIDGLVQARGKQLDLIVRTERPLAADVQGGIRHILLEAGAVTGLRGAAQFRTAPAPFLDAGTLPSANGRPRSSLVI